MDGYVTIGTKLDTNGLEEGLTRIEKGKKTAEGELDDIGKDSGKKIGEGLKSVGTKILGTVGSVAKGILSTIGGIVKGVLGVVGRIGLKLIGVTSALGLLGLVASIVTKAFTKIVDENQELLANIKYIVFVISNALAPVTNAVANMIANSIAKILTLLAKALTYIAYIIKAWFGIDILAGASVDKFKEASAGAKDTASNLGKASKNAKELKKQLAGFDEMNVLQDNTSQPSGGGAGGGIGGGGIGDIATPTLQFDAEIPEWIKWIADHKDEVIAGILGIASALGALYLGFGLVKSLGIGLLVAGIVLLIEGIIAYLQDPSWENFMKILAGIGLIVAGIALLIGPIPALIAGIILLIAAIGLAVYKNWDKIKAALSIVGQWIYDNIIEPVVNHFKDLWERIKAIFAPTIEFLKPIIEAIVETVKVNVENIIRFVKTIYDNIKIVIDNIKEIFNAIKTFIKEYVIKPISDILGEKINSGKQKIKAFVESIKSFFAPLTNFFSNLISKIKGYLISIGSSIGNSIAGAFKGVINSILTVAEGFLNKPINAVNKLIEKVNTLPGVHLTTLKTFRFARLAKGGIINQPGRGVAIGGEAGREGVIPLTDSQQMEILGEAIGRYITVNASITNTMNGRVISRELQKINNENDFAFNR